MKEYGKRCQICHKNRESRIYFEKINGKWLRICKACWEKENDRK